MPLPRPPLSVPFTLAFVLVLVLPLIAYLPTQQVNAQFTDPLTDPPICEGVWPGVGFPARMVMPERIVDGNESKFFLEVCAPDFETGEKIDVVVKPDQPDVEYDLAEVYRFSYSRYPDNRTEFIYEGYWNFECGVTYLARYRMVGTDWFDLPPQHPPPCYDPDETLVDFDVGLAAGVILVIAFVTIVGLYATKLQPKRSSRPQLVRQEHYVQFSNVYRPSIPTPLPKKIQKTYVLSESQSGMQFFRRDGRPVTHEDQEVLRDLYEQVTK